MKTKKISSSSIQLLSHEGLCISLIFFRDSIGKVSEHWYEHL
jgi:hypothetical protein